MSASSFLFPIEFEFYLKNSVQLTSDIGWIGDHPDTCTLLSPDAKPSKIKCKKMRNRHSTQPKIANILSARAIIVT